MAAPIPQQTLLAATTARRGFKETKADFLARLTHLNLSGKGLACMDGLHPCLSLRVLYLDDNDIEEVGNLAFASGLTHLYMRNNRLFSTLGLPSNLGRLEKLYLGGNFVGVIEGLDACENLRELHVGRQLLEEDEPALLFDDASLGSLSRSLEVLDVTGNRLTTLEQMAALRSLRTLVARENLVVEVDDVKALLGALPRLEALDLRENPVVLLPKYRDRVLVASGRALGMLDDRRVIPTQREALIRRAAGVKREDNGPTVEWPGGPVRRGGRGMARGPARGGMMRGGRGAARGAARGPARGGRGAVVRRPPPRVQPQP